MQVDFDGKTKVLLASSLFVRTGDGTLKGLTGYDPANSRIVLIDDETGKPAAVIEGAGWRRRKARRERVAAAIEMLKGGEPLQAEPAPALPTPPPGRPGPPAEPDPPPPIIAAEPIREGDLVTVNGKVAKFLPASAARSSRPVMLHKPAPAPAPAPTPPPARPAIPAAKPASPAPPDAADEPLDDSGPDPADAADDDTSGVVAGRSGQQLSEAQRERLEQIITDAPSAPDQWIIDKFAACYKRTVSIPTVHKYRALVAERRAKAKAMRG